MKRRIEALVLQPSERQSFDNDPRPTPKPLVTLHQETIDPSRTFKVNSCATLASHFSLCGGVNSKLSCVSGI